MNKILNKITPRINSKILSNNIYYSFLNKFLNLRKINLEAFYDYQTIYIDVSIIAKNDNHTGIQRVVREIIIKFITDDKLKDKLKFVVATKKLGYRIVELVDKENIKFDISSINKFSPLINPTSHDLFFGLDLALNIIPFHLSELLFWKIKGVTITWMIYDLLPLQHPEWFTSNINQNFLPWIKTCLLTGDILLCISNYVASVVNEFASEHGVNTTTKCIRLGANFKSYAIEESAYKEEHLNYGQYVLMVGTIEPRKGHIDIISSFEKLWADRITEIRLIIIGKQGWKVDELVSRIIKSSYYGHELIWLDNIHNDNDLKNFYQHSLGIINASYGEGYGLPIIEALYYSKLIFARDIEVFHEVSQNHYLVTFFQKNNVGLISDLAKWIKNLKNRDRYLGKSSSTERVKFLISTWDDCKNDIVSAFN